MLCPLLFVVSSVLLASSASAPPPPPQRWVSYWYSPANITHNALTLALLKKEGGTKVATSLQLYCGDSIGEDGTFKAGVSPGCDMLIPKLNAMGIGAERIVGAKDITSLRAMWTHHETDSIAAMVALAKQHKLRGMSWDVEPSGSNKADAVAYAGYLGKLRQALKPLNARLTTYNNMYDPVISDFQDIQHGVDRLLDGDTYNYHTKTGHTAQQNFSSWLSHYHDTVVNANISRDKAGVSMLASTERGDWNCESTTMAQRMKQLKADRVPELAIFILRSDEANECPGPLSHSSKLNPDGEPMCPCSNKWFPFARDFLAGK